MPRNNLKDQFTPEQRKQFQPRIIARNTFRYKDGQNIVTRLHSTDIVKELGDGRYQLNSGGWRTVTTKNRMNMSLCGYHLYQKAGAWYVCKGNYGYTGGIPYFDGMILPDAFNKPNKGEKVAAKEQKLVS